MLIIFPHHNKSKSACLAALSLGLSFGFRCMALDTRAENVEVQLSTVFMLMKAGHFNESNQVHDGKSYWLWLWWHPSGSPWGRMSPMGMWYSLEAEWAKPASLELWMEGKGAGGGSGLMGEAQHTHTDAVVWGQACCEGGFGWVELFACVSFWRGCLQGLLLEREEVGIYQTTSLPFSTSMRCDESEYSPVVYHNHSAILSFISAESVF